MKTEDIAISITLKYENMQGCLLISKHNQIEVDSCWTDLLEVVDEIKETNRKLSWVGIWVNGTEITEHMTEEVKKLLEDAQVNAWLSMLRLI